MKHVRVLGVAFALLLVFVFAVVPAFAQSGSTNNMSQNNMAAACINTMTSGNLTGMNNWQTLCGQSAVFAFDYSGNNDQAMVELATNPANSASFYIYPKTQFAMGVNQGSPLNGGNNSNSAQFVSTLGTPIGSGTQMTHKNSDGTTDFLNGGNLSWVGASPAADTYFVLVQPKNSQSTPFWINASGPGVSNFRFVPAGMQSTSTQGTLAMSTAPKISSGTAGGPPLTLPRTGGEFEAMQLLAAGAALVSAGLFLRRRK